MAEIIEFPVEAGGVLRVQAADGWESGEDLVAASGITDRVAQARESIEAAIASVTPALGAVTRQLRELSADEVTVDFGLLLGVEYGAVLAKGKGEVHFNISLTWKDGHDSGA